MTALKALRDDGWKIDEIKLREVMGDTFDEKMGKDEWKKILSDLDIKDYSEAFLSESISNKSLKGSFIVQLSKWENFSYPKINEHVKNDGVCSMIVTDGAKSTKAMTTEPLANISDETPYGAKILLTGDIKLENNILQLNPKNCKFIGGTVEKMVEKWKTERFSSKQDARNTSDAPKWSSLGAKGGVVVAAKNEKDNFKSMAAVAESKQNENSEFEAARQQEIDNLKELRKNVHIASVKLPENIKKDHTVPEKDEKTEANQKHDEVNPKPDKYERSNNSSSSGPRGGSNFRKGRNRDDTEDIRTYISRPSGTATLFDHIKTQMVNPPSESDVIQHDNIQVNTRANNGSSYNNRDGHNNTYQSNNSNVASHRFAQMKVSDGHQGYSRGGNNYRNDGNRGSRGRGGSSGGRGRGKPFNANYSNPYQQQQQFQQRPQQYQQQQPQFQPQQFPPLSAAAPRPNIFPPPAAAAGYVPPMSQHIRNPNATGIAPFSDNNVRKTYYNNSRKR